MNTRSISSLAVVLPLTVACVLTSSQALAVSPCEVVLCMSKPGEKECREAEAKFFSIVAFDGDGDFDPSDTRKAREKYLKQCPTADQGFISQIIGKYGARL